MGGDRASFISADLHPLRVGNLGVRGLPGNIESKRRRFVEALETHIAARKKHFMRGPEPENRGQQLR